MTTRRSLRALLPALALCAAISLGAQQLATRKAPTHPALASWLLASDPAHDLVRAADSEASLIRRLGPRNVRWSRIELEEGDSVDATVLFPHDALRRVEVVWGDPATRSRPERVIVHLPGSPWLVWPGIGIGSSLASLQRLNDGPFELTGMEGHSPGLVTSWRNGALSPLSDRVFVRLAPGDTVGHDCPRYPEIQSGWSNRSSHPAMACVAPVVYRIEFIPR
jgi:hypothetical protein